MTEKTLKTFDEWLENPISEASEAKRKKELAELEAKKQDEKRKKKKRDDDDLLMMMACCTTAVL